MIRYSLRCRNEHDFESWFRSAEDYDSLVAADRVACPDCADTSVSKAPMAPRVRASDKAVSPAEVMRKVREHVESTSEYVGDKFVTEARAMHDGEAPERPIYGEARLDEAKKLVEDGIPALPLPFVPKRKTN